MALPDFPRRKDLRGIGLSEWPGYLSGLEDRFEFLNTFFHQEPRLDITDPPREEWGMADFLIASEVFEHTPPPAQRAFDGAFRLLKPGGLLVLTVPFLTDVAETEEHFPDLYQWQLVQVGGQWVLVNRTIDGRVEVHPELRFHGGPGMTLEMRVFSQVALAGHLRQAGFATPRFHTEEDPTWGILWLGPWSVPITARRPS